MKLKYLQVGIFIIYVVLAFCLVCFAWIFLCFCVKPPAPEAQRLDDAIGFLRDHAEVNVSVFSFSFFFALVQYVLCLF